jgi:hypothetical protein
MRDGQQHGGSHRVEVGVAGYLGCQPGGSAAGDAGVPGGSFGVVPEPTGSLSFAMEALRPIALP